MGRKRNACAELGIGLMAYPPMAGGLLSGKITVDTKFEGDDIKHTITRYSEENLNKNQPVIEPFKKFAADKNAATAQISFAWVMYEKFIVPIPGMRKDNRIKENLGAMVHNKLFGSSGVLVKGLDK